MAQPIDLSIMFTEPPQDSPTEVIASVALRCDSLDLSWRGDLLCDPTTQQERDDLRWYLEDYWKWPYLEFAVRAKQVEALLHEIGKRLYNAVFVSSEAQALVQTWKQQQNVQHQVSIVSEIPSIQNIPWELLHDERGFLALRTDPPISIIRRLSQSKPAFLSTPFEPPLRILLITARPEGAGFIDPRSIARELLDEMQAHIEAKSIEIEFLRPPTLAALRARLKNTERPIHVLHFDGHGMFDKEKARQGILLFETETGLPSPIKASDLAKVLEGSGIQLAMLTACQSAVSATDDAFNSVAAQMIQSGIDAVVAMSANILVVSATSYVEAFYRGVARGLIVQEAEMEARQALYQNLHRKLSRGHYEKEDKLVELHDWWLPQFYQRRHLELRPVRPSSTFTQSLNLPSIRKSEYTPDEPRYGFNGRTRELLRIERLLAHGKIVVIHGFGGVGKTALVREAADWFTRTGMYAGACFFSFEKGGDAATLLDELGNYLGISKGKDNPQDQTEVLARLIPILREKRILVIADNFESILPLGETALDEATRSQLLKILLALAETKAGVLLASRSKAFGNEQLGWENKVAYLEIKGLEPEDAYTLATHLLISLGIDRASASYSELRDLLARLDYQPLSIQLVLPTLRDLPLSRVNADFAALLSTFEDDRETGRNRSLLASLEYSLQQLDEEQRVLLPSLALFEGGASEDNLLAIAVIPETNWLELRHVLEQAALLTVERIHNNIATPFLHFHPVLTSYLRGQTGARNVVWNERYAQHYFRLMRSLAYEDDYHPEKVRSQVQRELPNFLRALEILLERGELDNASDMARSIGRFLVTFGLRRLRNDMQQRVANAVTASNTRRENVLSIAEFWRENDLGDDELLRGDAQAAFARFTSLLARIEALPESTPLGANSYQHCVTLHSLARCLIRRRQSAMAEVRLREALVIIEALITRQPDNQHYNAERAVLLSDLGEALLSMDRHSQAREAYEKSLEIATQQGNLRQQFVVYSQLGVLEVTRGHHAEVRSIYTALLQVAHSLGEPSSEAIIWHQLGEIARELGAWDEAEQCYRESLSINVSLGNVEVAAKTCHQLANAAKDAGRLSEAEGWYKHAIDLFEQLYPGNPEQVDSLRALATLLVDQAVVNRAPVTRLAEAKDCAVRALTVEERFGISSKTWQSFHVLASIAETEGHIEAARNYRQKGREAFASIESNRSQIDHDFGSLIVVAAVAAIGDVQARATVVEALPKYEATNWHLTVPIQRILAGERNWHALVEDLNPPAAVLMLRVLETLEQIIASEIQRTEPLIQSIVSIAQGDTTSKAQMEEELSIPEARHLRDSIHRIWRGERNTTAVTRGLDEMNAALIKRVLEVLARE